MRPVISARARTAITSTESARRPGDDLLGLLRDGALEVLGRLIGSSNNAMVVRVRPADSAAPARRALPRPVAGGDLPARWEPTARERPPLGLPLRTLSRRR